MRTAVLVSFVFYLIAFASAQHSHVHDAYRLEENLQIECIHPGSSSWERGPRCGNGVMEIKYGVDGMNRCELSIANTTMYTAVAKVINFESSWSCRVKMTPNSQIWLPFFLPLWGIVEKDHMHVDNHMNMIFHGANGNIIGAAAYPLKDQFAFVTEGTVLQLHGSTKWFKRGSFAGFSLSLVDSDSPLPAIISIAFLCSSITFMATFLCSIGIFECYLKPNMKTSFVKMKTN